MSQTAASLPVAPTSHTAPHHVAQAIDAYVSATFERFEAVLVAQVPTLSEPRTDDPRKAFRLVQQMTETLVGFAVGTAVGAVASAMKRQFGSTAAAAIDAELRRIASGMGVQGTVAMPIRIPRFFANELVAAEKPLADDLGGRALLRLRQVAADARRHLNALAKACDRASAFVMTLELLAPDETTAMGFTDQIATAWERFRQRLGAKPTVRSLAPGDAARFARADATWNQFSSASSPKAPTLTTHDEIVAAGFLMQIG